MKEERTETWNPWQLPTQPQPQVTPDPDITSRDQPPRFDPRGTWTDPVAAVVRPR